METCNRSKTQRLVVQGLEGKEISSLPVEGEKCP